MNAARTTSLGIDHSPYGYLAGLVLLLALALAGAWVFVDWLGQEPGPEAWALFTINFLFLLGITQFGVVFSAIMRICGAEWSKPFYRIAELTTIAFLPLAFAGFLLIYFCGRADLLFWLSDRGDAGHLSSWLNTDWLLIRNLVAQLIFYAVAVAYFITALLPDVHADAAATGPAWRRALYRRLLAYRGAGDPAAVQQRLYVLSVLVLPACALPNTFMAWDFGMMLYPHYHSSVFTMYFMMGSLVAGAAALLLLRAVVSRYVNTAPYFGVKQIHSMAILLTGFVLFWLYLWWAQFFVSWFGNLDHNMDPLRVQMEGHYALLFWLMLACMVGIPLAALIFHRIKRTAWTMHLVALVILAGVWLNRYLTVMPAVRDDHAVMGAFHEIAVTVGWLAAFLFLLMWLISVFPAISRWEIAAGSPEGEYASCESTTA